jgi:hypothetical protein
MVMRQQPHCNYTAAQGLISDHDSLGVRILTHFVLCCCSLHFFQVW